LDDYDENILLNSYLDEQDDNIILNQVFDQLEVDQLELDTNAWTSKEIFDLLNAPSISENSLDYSERDFDYNTIDVDNINSSLSEINIEPYFDFDETNLNNLLVETVNQDGCSFNVGSPVISEKFNTKWNATQKIIVFSIPNESVTDFFNGNDILEKMFEKIFQEYIMTIPADNMVQFILDHDILNNPISSCYMKRRDLTSSMILNAFKSVFQSRKKYPKTSFKKDIN
jgi:hypothetical protein